jgi:hypothetical protein
MIIKRPKENSKPAKANKKNDVDIKFMSSFNEPNKTDKTYKTTHTISEYKIKLNKLLEFKKNKNKDNQKIEFQNTNQLCIIFYL